MLKLIETLSQKRNYINQNLQLQIKVLALIGPPKYRPMKKRFIFIPLILLLIIFMIFVAISGFNDKVDALWTESANQLTSHYVTLDHKNHSLEDLYYQIHGSNDEWDKQKILCTPFCPLMEYENFETLVQTIAEQKSGIFYSVSGAGTTTKIDRLAKFISSSNDHILTLNCAPQFEIEYHKKYISQEIDGKFQKGILLKFMDKCIESPDENFVFLIDNLDKINPETFWGPEIWRKMDDEHYTVKFGTDTFNIPENFYALSVSHAGKSSKISLNNEHFKRIGQPYYIAPSVTELILYLRETLSKKQEEINNEALTAEEKDDIQRDITSLRDTAHLQKFIYSFQKINDVVSERFTKNHRLGQWSSLRKLYSVEDYDKFIETFVNHVNALEPEIEFGKSDLRSVIYSVNHDGKLKGSNAINQFFKRLEQSGYLTEILVGLAFLLISGLVSIYLLRRRRQYIRDYTHKVYGLIDDFEKNKIDYEDVSKKFIGIKRKVDQMIIDGKINYTEATFFYSFIEERIRGIELGREANNSFQELVNLYLEDEIITNKEYKKLHQFLSRIKHKISIQDYDKFNSEIEHLYDTHKHE